MNYYLTFFSGLLMFCMVSCNHVKDSNDPIDKLVTNYSQTISKDKYVSKAYFKETAKIDDEYVMYTDAYGYLISAGYDYEIPLDNFSFVSENMRKSDRKEIWLKNLEYLYESTKVTSQSDINPGYNSLLNIVKVFEKNGPLNAENVASYSFLEVPSQDTTSSILAFAKKEKNGRIQYSGQLFFDGKTFNIQRVVIDSCNDFYSEVFFRRVNSKVIIEYKYEKDQLYIHSLYADYSLDNLNHTVELDILEQPNENLVFNAEDYGSLFFNDGNPFVVFDPTKWDNKQFPLRNLESLKKDLDKTDKPLEAQFVSNAGKSYMESYVDDVLDDPSNNYKAIEKIKLKIKSTAKN